MIEPDGTVVSYAELAGRADQIGRGLQALGLRPGDCVAGMLPNSSAALALFFAAMETGLYVVPVNWHLAAAEVAYILGDSGAGAFVADERFAAVAAAAADQAGIAARTPGSRSARSPGSPRCPTWARAARAARTQRTQGAPMVYTSGTSGRPKGVRRALTGAGPGRRPGRQRLVLRPVRPGAVRRPRAPVLLAALPHGGAELRDDLPPARPSGRADGRVRPGGHARADRAAPGDPHAHGADAVPAAARAARAGPVRVRRQLACAPRSTAPRRARRKSSGR